MYTIVCLDVLSCYFSMLRAGSKCPTGEHLYSIESQDNAALKKLFSDLSNHKPIFSDDRLGRRMTLEKKFSQTAHSGSNSPQRAGKNRYVHVYVYIGYFHHHSLFLS